MGKQSRAKKARKADKEVAPFDTFVQNMAHTPCVLCGDLPSVFPGVFVPGPDEQKRFGAPYGKTRKLLYSVCASCTPYTEEERRLMCEKVETVLLERLQQVWAEASLFGNTPGEA